MGRPKRPVRRNLYEAAASGDLPGLIAALRPTTDIDALHGEPPYGKAALHVSVENSHLHIVGVPQALGSNIKTRGSPDSFTALHFAAIRANLGAVHLLLGSGADHNARYEIWGGDGGPATFLVLIRPYWLLDQVEQRHSGVIQLLLNCDVDVNAAGKEYGDGNLVRLT